MEEGEGREEDELKNNKCFESGPGRNTRNKKHIYGKTSSCFRPRILFSTINQTKCQQNYFHLMQNSRRLRLNLFSIQSYFNHSCFFNHLLLKNRIVPLLCAFNYLTLVWYGAIWTPAATLRWFSNTYKNL